MSDELKIKLSRVRELMAKESLDAVILNSIHNFYWITGGKGDMVDRSCGEAAAKILITKDKAYAICNSSEMYRVFDEELTDGTFELIGFRWHEDETAVVSRYVDLSKTGSDTGVYGTRQIAGLINPLRYVLTPEEEARMQEIGPLAAGILEDSVRDIQPGETEMEAAGRCAGRLIAAGFAVPVMLVASDERLFKYRHPLPTTKKIEKYAMIAICAQKYGLTISISRIVSFEPLSEEIRTKYEALLKIDATYILNTKAGVMSRDVLAKAYEVYKETGFEADFHLHHQGGALGYLTRDYCTNERTEAVVLDHQGYSWNPTIAGVKLEDTYVIKGDTQDIVSYTGKWVYRDVDIDGITIKRPDILVKEL
ncbi:MAG: M24 family metallopeptidase [Lachnospiraceae bacterium]|nr:M24 family metallopeptidase [Lachnospiraceae bacterium]